MAYHIQKLRCASCAYPEAKIRNPCSEKCKRKRGYGTGRLRYVKRIGKRFVHPELKALWDKRGITY
ncbi:hypothetical protein CWI38_0735p0010 [Hamiltosporidium tvaerminnensis]|uniref:Ribosomal protein L37 n=1 Tax=Hamiltosporidium tvaerminnensis TaxID=1176355 RepID=A0A4Q9LUZ6_9MICR|nr:hypothetical protein CWI38_0735p0010 [Hamiltosporidium tvaerminnensis]